MPPPTVVALFGPTGVGKTSVAVALAARLRARGEDPVAVSADALQLYAGLPILTGAPAEDERAALEHRLVGTVPLTETFSAGRYARLAHAEIDALRAAASALGTSRLDGCDLWVTLEPCAMCAGAIALSRISRLYFGAPDPKGGAVIHGPRLFGQPTCHHAPEIYGGIHEGESADLLRAFFRDRRG